jgi:dihydrofolate synthase/folylpolyglutamate synthase
MNYKQTLEYFFEKLPMFHRTGSLAYKANLDNALKICKLVGNPEQKFKSIHVGGTNGKGSTSHMLASVLQAAGYKVGLFTSPHLKDFRERIKVNGKMIPKVAVSGFLNKYLTEIETIQPSFFEMTVGLAFEYFANQNIDIGIIEVGLGGRLDATNVITPELSLITNIGWDHTDLLGDSLVKIAFEKAGIIKNQVPVVISESQKEVSAVFIEKAHQQNSPVCFADANFKIEKLADEAKDNNLHCRVHYKNKVYLNSLRLDLTGSCQLKNSAGVLQALENLKEKGYVISKKAIIEGLNSVKKKTGIAGRWHLLGTDPLTICDTGHNLDGLKQVLEQIKATPHKVLHFVIGFVKEKDLSAILSILPKDAIYYFCHANIPRALDAVALSENAKEFHLIGNAYPSVKEALDHAKRSAQKGDLVFVGGSTFVVAEIIK